MIMDILGPLSLVNLEDSVGDADVKIVLHCMRMRTVWQLSE